MTSEVVKFSGPVKCASCGQELTALEFSRDKDRWPIMISMPMFQMLELGLLIHPNCGGRLETIFGK